MTRHCPDPAPDDRSELFEMLASIFQGLYAIDSESLFERELARIDRGGSRSGPPAQDGARTNGAAHSPAENNRTIARL